MSYFAFKIVSQFYLALIIFLLNDIRPNETKVQSTSEYKVYLNEILSLHILTRTLQNLKKILSRGKY